ncbi:hypothetical protein [Actinomadura rubrisoli]|uniref:Uncharacterized protein n=1 Tax=Actinomadura rubrisoli TaxID=2530368 RepID=A0A4V2YUU3_9ACTN|nr:hypothetical protein [Actinomadura rubrisoli]TDD79047.1 hypothetical protein E1298_28630 [Actinomadura rubrisoli]
MSDDQSDGPEPIRICAEPHPTYPSQYCTLPPDHAYTVHQTFRGVEWLVASRAPRDRIITRPGGTLVDALPELDRLLEQIGKTLNPAMLHSPERLDEHGTGNGHADTMRTLLKAFTFAVEAARAGQAGDAAALHKALREVDTVASRAAEQVRDLRAAGPLLRWS